MNKTADLLFFYLKDILYDNPNASLDLSSLDPAYRDLGEGLQFLNHCIREMYQFTEAISTGNLSAKTPEKDNPLCANLKNLQANLNHLTWQAQQVSLGDYQQHVAFLGQFSDAFNSMTTQLKEREAQLSKQADYNRQRAEAFSSYNELLINLTKNRHEWIFVSDNKTGEVIYCNRFPSSTTNMHCSCSACPNAHAFGAQIKSHQDSEEESYWEYQDATSHHYYGIHCFPLLWEDRKSTAHIAEDITKEKDEEYELSVMAYRDSNTGLYNRRYFIEQFSDHIKQKQAFTLIYIDLDGLKYVNDHFGHIQGDRYLQALASLFTRHLDSTALFARLGGDEFAALLPNWTESQTVPMVESLYHLFRDSNTNYIQSFSYGIVSCQQTEDFTDTESILKIADERMYLNKIEHKQIINTIR